MITILYNVKRYYNLIVNVYYPNQYGIFFKFGGQNKKNGLSSCLPLALVPLKSTIRIGEFWVNNTINYTLQ